MPFTLHRQAQLKELAGIGGQYQRVLHMCWHRVTTPAEPALLAGVRATADVTSSYSGYLKSVSPPIPWLFLALLNTFITTTPNTVQVHRSLANK